MTFGQLKSIIEENLLNSYKNEAEFKKTLREFKGNVLKNKKLSKLFSVYEQLSTPQGLSEKEADIFLNEGLNLISKIIHSIKMPYSKNTPETNSYVDIDNLVYTTKHNITERIQSKKSIIGLLMSEPKRDNDPVKIPLNSMVKIANQTLENYIQSMDSGTKKLFLEVIKSEKESLEKQYLSLKETTITKLNNLLSEQDESEMKTKISETIEKLHKENFSQINYVKLISLENGL